MKKVMITLSIVFAILTILYINGSVNYYNAINCGKQSEGTDSGISNCNKQYGYDLDWNETPTNTQIILSNFQ